MAWASIRTAEILDRSSRVAEIGSSTPIPGLPLGGENSISVSLSQEVDPMGAHRFGFLPESIRPDSSASATCMATTCWDLSGGKRYLVLLRPLLTLAAIAIEFR